MLYGDLFTYSTAKLLVKLCLYIVEISVYK